MSITSIDTTTLNDWLDEDGELAVLDLRTLGQFGKWGAPLQASNLPYATLQRDLAQYVPRKNTRLVLVDDGTAEAQARHAATQLAALGYTQLHVLQGGFPAWLAAGHTRSFSVTGNDYAEQIRSSYQTPLLTVQQLQALHAENGDVIVLDTRAPDEYAAAHVPGAVSVPGAELVQRFADLVPSPQTLVVVSCALLARAILGAQTLINADVPNRVAYLHEGTKAWHEAGLTLETGPTRSYGPASAAAEQLASDKVRHLEHAAIRQAGPAQLAAWRAEADRTTYLLDVRSAREYADGHLDGAVSAPGGQLILGTFRFLAVRGARLVLIDDNGVRATTTAHWLRQRGWEVHVHRQAVAHDQAQAA